MKKLLREPVLIIGFVISWVTAASLIIAGQDSILSALLGLAGSAIVMLIDVLLNLQHNKDEVLKTIESRLGPEKVVLLPRQYDVYRTATEMINAASPGANIYLTAVTMEPTVDSPEKTRYRKVRDKRIAKDDCNFYRILTVADEKSLEQLKESLSMNSRVRKAVLMVNSLAQR